MNLIYRRSISLCLFSVFLASGAAYAQKPAGLPAGYPSKPIRFVVGAAPGGGADFLARLVAGKLSEKWSHQWIVENISSGVGGIVALEQTLRGPTDGYNFQTSANSTLLNAAFVTKIPFDIKTAIAPVAQFTDSPLLFALNSQLPYSNLKEFIAGAKAKPGALAYGTSGIGSSGHLAGELLGYMAGVKLNHIPYKGAGQSMVDAISGQIQVVIGSPTALVPQIRSGKLKLLGSTAARRMPSSPDIPTIAEQGLPGFSYIGWIGMIAKSGTPQPIIQAVHTDVRGIINNPEVQKILLKTGSDPADVSLEEFRKEIIDSLNNTEKLIKEAGLQLN